MFIISIRENQVIEIQGEEADKFPKVIEVKSNLGIFN